MDPKSNFSQRALTGIIFVIVLIGSIIFHPLLFWILFGFISSMATREFYQLAEKDGAQPQKNYGIGLALLLFALTAITASGYLSPIALFVFAPLIFALFIIELYRKKASPFLNIGYTLLGILYVAFPFSLLNFLVFQQKEVYSFHLILGYFIILWSSDTGAYLVGKAIGKHPLFPRVSPKKTWEGTFGGAGLGLLGAWGLSCFFKEYSLVNWLVIAAIIVVMGSLGDLVESLFKRSIDTKDSGSLLPGHGGLLDRFDGLLISVPFIWFYLLLNSLF
jgi:phosphatidate cytidylyltransferase